MNYYGRNIMGYESKLYIVEEANFKIPSDNGKVWAEVIGVINMCNCYKLTEVFTTETNSYIYADDGNTRIEKDKYGKPLTVAEIDDVIKCLKTVVKEDGYWRAKIAIDFLKSIKKENPNCKVYHFGY